MFNFEQRNWKLIFKIVARPTLLLLNAIILYMHVCICGSICVCVCVGGISFSTDPQSSLSNWHEIGTKKASNISSHTSRQQSQPTTHSTEPSNHRTSDPTVVRRRQRERRSDGLIVGMFDSQCDVVAQRQVATIFSCRARAPKIGIVSNEMQFYDSLYVCVWKCACV